ncbi:MAG: DUF433 domain-containing protein [Bacteroidota bacterium]
MERIAADPRVLGGKPRIQGTHISVELMLERMASGATPESGRRVLTPTCT